jgi:hypothetical protein
LSDSEAQATVTVNKVTVTRNTEMTTGTALPSLFSEVLDDYFDLLILNVHVYKFIVNSASEIFFELFELFWAFFFHCPCEPEVPK